MGSYRTYLYLVKLQPWFLSLQWNTRFWTVLQAWFLCLQLGTCPWAQHSDDERLYNLLINRYDICRRNLVSHLERGA